LKIDIIAGKKQLNANKLIGLIKIGGKIKEIKGKNNIAFSF
jgi:hypothetical protein